MKKGNKIAIILIIVISIVSIIVGIGIWVYVKTDFLKSDKQVFFKYFAQNLEIIDILQEKDLAEYFQKEQEQAYENKGEIEVQVEGTKHDEIISQFKIRFDGKKEEANQLKEQNITIDYGKDITFPLQFKQADTIYAIKSEYIGQNYIGIKDDGTMLENYEMERIRKIDATSNLKKGIMAINAIEESYLSEISNLYLPILYNAIEDTNFTKTNKEYRMQLSKQDVETIIEAVTEKMKQDVALKAIWEKIQTGKKSETFETVIESIEKTLTSLNTEEQYTITLTKEKGKLQVTTISAGDKSIVIEKKEQQIDVQINRLENETTIQDHLCLKKQKTDEVVYTALLEDGEEKVNMQLTASFTGLDTKQQVTEDYQIQAQTAETGTLTTLTSSNTPLKLHYHFTTTKKFIDNFTFIPLTNENMLLLNDQAQEQQVALMKALVERWFYVSTWQMQELGIEEKENPLYIVYRELASMDANAIIPKSQIEAQLQLVKDTYNSRLRSYQGEQTGSVVKALLDTIRVDFLASKQTEIDLSPETKKEQVIKTILFEGQTYEVTLETLQEIREKITNGKNYEIQFSYGEGTGLIQHVSIKNTQE